MDALEPERGDRHARDPYASSASYGDEGGSAGLDRADHDWVHPVDSAICITVYNEPLVEVEKTISSVVRAIAWHDQQRSVATRVGVYLVVDGSNFADPDLLRWLERQEAPTSGGVLELEGESIRIRSFPAGSDEAVSSGALATTLHSCVKDGNAGKLHSHALFFRQLCRVLRPRFCWQIDAGTVIEQRAYYNLVSKMEDQPDIGAIAPFIMVPPPHPSAMFLSVWQYFDFVLQKALSWPFEVAAGNLSVVPGQFCMFRWEALENDSEYSAVGLVDGFADRPVESYLRGLNTVIPLEKIMFLAEDRVVGNEIALRRNANWKLAYCPSASALTDSCQSMGELMRQRRRWNNSALACRIWLFGKMPEFVRRPDRTVVGKARFLVAMLSQFILMMMELAAPAIAFATLLVFRNVLAAATTPFFIYSRAVLGASLLILIGASLLGKMKAASHWRTAVYIRSIGDVLCSVLLCLLLWNALPRSSLLVLTIPTVSVVLAITLLDWRLLRNMVFWNNIYIISGLFFAPLLSGYSIFNLHDVSWGTKGLTSVVAEECLKRQMRVYRNWAVALWIAINTALGALTVWLPGMTSPRLSLVFEIICLFGSATAFVSAGYLALLRLGRKKGRPIAQVSPEPIYGIACPEAAEA